MQQHQQQQQQQQHCMLLEQDNKLLNITYTIQFQLTHGAAMQN